MRTTTFDTAQNEMTVDFGNGNQLVHNNNLNRAYLIGRGALKAVICTAGLKLNAFTQMLDNIEGSLQ